MNEPLAYLLVFLAAATPWLEVLIVIPAGILAGLAPAPTAVIGAAGNIASLVPLVIGGDRLRSWWQDRRARRHPPAPTDTTPAPGTDGRNGRATRVFRRFGLPGLALLGPLVTGIHVAAVVGLAGGGTRRATIAWLGGGVILWSVIAALAAVIGIDSMLGADQLPDWFDMAAA